MAVKDFDQLTKHIVRYMKRQAIEAGTTKAEIDVSGGVDSAVVAALACRAFGSNNVIGVYSGINSSPESKERAREVAETFGFKLVELELTGIFSIIRMEACKEFRRLGLPWPKEKDDPAVFGSLRSCLRAPIGRFINRAFGGGIRQGTGNRDEDELVRFYQKGGDGEVDCNWMECLYKSEVWELAEYLGVPESVIKAVPTPDLWGVGNEHNDEDELEDMCGVRLTYTRPGEEMGSIEWVTRENDQHGIIDGIEEFTSVKILAAYHGYTDEQCQVIEAVRKMEKMTRHKAEMPPTISRESIEGMRLVE
jgi:NAD+ synthetase